MVPIAVYAPPHPADLRFARRGLDEMIAPVDINAIACDAILAANLERDAAITLRIALFAGLPPVDGSPARLTQALLSLLVHARHALSGVVDGAIDVETEPDGECVAIRVLDNGPGIPQERLERIFDPFSGPPELNEWASDDAKGNPGLGLATAYEIIRDHRGRLEVRSRPGEGTCFVALIPFQHD
jgi:two-component system NtrC family sensor kinase